MTQEVVSGAINLMVALASEITLWRPKSEPLHVGKSCESR